MNTFNRGLNCTIVDDQAYTEDNVLVYNICLENVIQNIQLKEALNYFEKYGQVLSGNVFLQNIYIKFADSKVAAKVLQERNHFINTHHIVIRAAHSCYQPCGDMKTEQPSCSSISSGNLEASIHKLDVDCLEQICLRLNIDDQINLSQTCRRLSDLVSYISRGYIE